MTPFAKHLHRSFQDALNLNKPMPTSVLCEWEQSSRAEDIARMLAECGAFQLQQQPKPWKDLPQEIQDRFRLVAEWAIRQIDVAFADKAMQAAVKETSDWLTGPFQNTPVSVEEIAREVIHRYIALLTAGPAVQS